ncbi:ParB/RepB/Spo0J family partition protein, partial [Streptomyces sp. NPDC005900]|uniref:ParB/RepB/Spo0J family partition protein n=1 Tax=Streptomyces sp. NPDC005900 TaxID=3154569 RepID=UPI0033C02717
LLVCNADAFLAEHPEQASMIGDAKYVIIAGHRRYAAAKLAGLDKVRIDVRDELLADMDLVMLEENLKRKALNVLQEGEGYRRLAKKKGLSHAAIASKVGKGKSTITKRIALLDLPAEAKEAVLEKRVSVDTAYNLLVALGQEHRHLLMEAAAILKKDRDATAADAVNLLLSGSDRTAPQTTPAALPTTGPETGSVLTEPAPKAAPASATVITAPSTEVPSARTEPTPAAPPESVPNARNETHSPVLPEPEPGAAGAPAEPKKNIADAGRAQSSAARNLHCALLVKQDEKPNQDPQTLRIASTVLTQASPAALKRAHTWMKQAEAADASAFEAASYRDAVLVRGDGDLIARLAYAVALAEDELRASNRSRNWDYRDLAHLKHLTEAGYEPTEWERRQLG